MHYQADWKPHRDELIISSKAGYDMWKGPYGDHGSRKYLIASCDQSLKRTGLEYFDIFYHHRPDPDTPIEETMQALDYIVRSGRALYVGISNYNAEQAAEAAKVLKSLGTPLLVNQVKYSMFSRWPEDGLMDALKENGVGMTAFSPLAGGLLTAKYSAGIPADSRAKTDPRFLAPDRINPAEVEKARKLAAFAAERGDTPSQLALRWVLRNPVMTSAIIGASKPEQVLDNIGATRGTPLSEEELAKIDAILNG